MESNQSQSGKSTSWSFIYNAINQKVESLDEAFKCFMKIDSIHKKGFAFLNITPGSSRLFATAVHICLDSKISTTLQFNATLKNRVQEAYHFKVHVTCLKPVSEGDDLKILFTGYLVEKKLAKSDTPHNIKQETITSDDQMQSFLHLAVHDLSAPVRKLSTLMERFTSKAKKDLDTGYIIYINRMESVFKQLKTLIDSLAVLYEVSSQNNVFNTCNLNSLLDELLFEMDGELKAVDAKVQLSSLPTIKGDTHQLKLLFQSIIYNAVIFRKETTTLRIDISSKILLPKEKIAHNLPLNKVYYQFIIEDNGSGFDEQNFDIIFQPFQKLLGQKFSGSGLGLTICSKIVQNHHGIIYSKAVKESGAQFIIIIPKK